MRGSEPPGSAALLLARWATLRSRLALSGCRQVGDAPVVEGRLWVHGPGAVLVGSRVRFEAASAPIELHAGPGAELAIGDDVRLEGGASLEAMRSVTVGRGAQIGAFAKIMDNHFHASMAPRHHRPESDAVVIGESAVIGRRAILLPGARVAPGAVVRPGTVVRRPPGASTGPILYGREEGESVPDDFILRLVANLRRDPSGMWWRALGRLRAPVLFRGRQLGRGATALGFVRVEGDGQITVGDRACFVGGMIPTELRSHPGATLALGDECMVNYAVSIEAHAAIRIGRRCMLGSFVRLCDRARDRVAPITIGDDVWLAHGAIVEPGVTIGDGSTVSAGSVVSRDAPPRSLLVGNPARAISLPHG